MKLIRVKRIIGYAAHSRFLCECDDTYLGVVPRQSDIPSPYAYSPTHYVQSWNDIPIIVVETGHRRYDVFSVPRSMIQPLPADEVLS